MGSVRQSGSSIFLTKGEDNAIISFENSCACNGGIPVRRDERTGGGAAGAARAQNAVDLAGGLNAAGKLQGIGRARGQAHRRRPEDRGHGGRTGGAGIRGAGRRQQEGPRRRARGGLLLAGQELGRDAVRVHAGRAFRHGPHGFPRMDVRRRRDGNVLGLVPEHTRR